MSDRAKLHLSAGDDTYLAGDPMRTALASSPLCGARYGHPPIVSMPDFLVSEKSCVHCLSAIYRDSRMLWFEVSCSEACPVFEQRTMPHMYHSALIHTKSPASARAWFASKYHCRQPIQVKART
jgi:hypothetical protein